MTKYTYEFDTIKNVIGATRRKYFFGVSQNRRDQKKKNEKADTHHSYTCNDGQQSHRAHSVRIFILLFANGFGKRALNIFFCRYF